MSDGEGPLVEHLFREEAGRLLAALARLLGLHNLALAEDVVQDTLVRALETWRFGVPENPSAWLMRAAKNRALDLIRRERTRRRFAPELGGLTDDERTLAQAVEARFAEHELADDVLRMMFTCCAPRLPGEVQVALVLKLLCGFSAGEIAAAFLASEAAVEKQLQRGRRALAAAGALYEVSGAAAIRERLGAVHQALYLLFNEGYHASRRDEGVREELCHEALRLGHLLAEHPVAGVPSTQALLALTLHLTGEGSRAEVMLRNLQDTAIIDAEHGTVSWPASDSLAWQ